MSDFLMPALGADMTEATIVEWLKSEGDAVHRGDVVAVVETVKGAIEIEIFEDGILGRIKAPVGETIPVGAVLAEVRANGAGDATQQPAPEPQASGPSTISEKPVIKTKIRVSPAALRRADELSLDIADVAAGSDGVVGIAEVEAAGKAPTPARPPSKQGLDLDAMRQAIGKAMARSKREIPHYYVESTFSMSAFMIWLEALNKKRSVEDRILYAAPLIKAVALALSKAPSLNGIYDGDTHQRSKNVHLGVATAMRGGGLIAPALHYADRLTVDETMAKLRYLVSRVRQGQLRGSELSDPTATISILGEDTADSLQPVIYPPQVAIIGCGAIRKRPWAIGGSVEVHPVMTVTIAADHRASDGRAAGKFLNELKTLLKRPEIL